MTPLSTAAEKALRHRTFKWCRLENGFIDLPIWRVVSGKASVPLHAVQAFVVRLESLGNAAQPRGYVGDLKLAEFATALGMAAEEATRILQALTDPAIGWIEQEHIASFYGRNPDRLDETAKERQQRSRMRKDVRKKLSRLAGVGRIDPIERTVLEATLEGLADETLNQLQIRLANALSTGHAGHNVTLRDIVTVTPEQSTDISTAAVDNCDGGARGSSPSSPKEQEPPDEHSSTEAARWLETEGVRLIVELCNEPTARAAMLIERWGRDLNDAPLMVQIVAGAVDADLSGAKLQLVIGEQVKRHVHHKLHGGTLPLMPPRPGKGRLESPAEVVTFEPAKRRAAGE